MDQFEFFTDVFDRETFRKIGKDIMGPNWQFGHGSNTHGGYDFWRMDLMDNPFYSHDLLNIIREKTQQDYELSDVYANGHTFGTQGAFHVDWYDSSGRTFLYYANPTWRPIWGGKTAFHLGNDEMYYHDPKPNSAILFPGNIQHAAEATTRPFTGLRVTFAWKLILK